MRILNLHTHSQYSLLDGLNTVEGLIKKTKEFGLKSLCITDHGNMNVFGTLYAQCKKEDIKPIFGIEFYGIKSLKKWREFYAEKDGEKADKDSKEKLKKRNHIIILAKNAEGLKNLNKMIYESYENFYHRPRIDHKILEKYHEGLICSAACISGEIQKAIIAKDRDAVENSICFYKDLFGKDFYLEIQFNEMKDQPMVNLEMLKLSRKHKIKTIITGDAHYLNKSDQATHQTLLLLQSKKTYKDLAEGKAWSFDTKNLSFKNAEQYLAEKKKYDPGISERDFSEMCENTLEIDEKIENIKVDTAVKMKDINPDISDKTEHLRKLCFKELKNKDLDDRYSDRLDYELKVIKAKKMENYFLTVYDIVQYAKKEMFVGCGRGSGAGSLINYLLGITEIDPIRHKLYFERFLSIDRADPPDIDIDFEDNDKVKRYVLEKYERDAAYISNYSTFQLYGILKDLGRVYNIENQYFFDDLNRKIEKELDQNAPDEEENRHSVTFEEAYSNSKSFKTFIDKHPDIVNDLKILLGKIRHIGKHAAGVVIADKLIEKQPMVIIKGVAQTSLTEGTKGKELSDFGFVKIDILGLTTLKIMKDCINMIPNNEGFYEKHIHPDVIDLKDEKVYKKIFGELNLMGVFQFEGLNIQQMINRVEPDCFRDLVAINALFRPGPLQSGMAFEYGDRKRGVKEAEYYGSDIVKKILSKTFGILIFQEQIMELGHFLGGLSLADTNVLRKLLDKQKKLKPEEKEKLEKMRKEFFKNALEKKMDKDDVETLWGNMVAFSGYGFNKSHSVSYAMIAYQCAWLKTYYPLQFYCALMNNVDKADEYIMIVNELKNNGFKIEGVDINKSDVRFSIRDDKIYWGIGNLVGVGEVAATEIVKSRKARMFDGLKDFVVRDGINWRSCNKKIVEALIRVGAFDFASKGLEQRNFLLSFYNEFMEMKSRLPKKQSEWPMSERLRTCKNAIDKARERKNPKLTEEEKMSIELQYYKLNIKNQAIDLKGRRAKMERLIKNKMIRSFQDDDTSEYGEYILAQFIEVFRFKDKNNHEMAFIDMSDHKGKMRKGIIFSSDYQAEKIIAGHFYLIKGRSGDKMIINVYKDLDKVLNEEER